MTETSPGASRSSWTRPLLHRVMDGRQGASHAVKFVWTRLGQGATSDGLGRPMVLDTGMSNLYLNLKEA
jgi:hypothetical protein